MKNKLLSAILALALLLSHLAIPALAEDEIPTSGTCGETVTWALDETGLLTISGTGPMTDYATYTETPWYESIDPITALVIGDGVTTIGDRSFYGCEALATVTLPEGITTIGNSAFYSCVGLTEVLLPQTLTAIGDYAFAEPLKIGDRLVFGDMAIYSTCKNNTFNGMPLPPIWLLGADGNCRELVHFGYQDFKMRLGAQ